MKNTVVREIAVLKSKREPAETILNFVESLFDEAELDHLETLARAVKPQAVSSEDVALAKEIAGDDYSSEKTVILELVNLQKLYERRRQLLANSITSTEVAKLLGCRDRSTIHDRRLAQSLLGLKEHGKYYYPLWQFDPEGDDGVIDGLPQVLAALEVSDFIKLNWLTKPHRAFHGRAPLEVLKLGEIEAVIAEARTVGLAQ